MRFRRRNDAPMKQLLASFCALTVAVALSPLPACGQVAYFVDGFHGGVYGHYPTNYTEFIVDSLARHPGWKINLEIEPETWDSAQKRTPKAYADLQRLLS